MDGLGGRNAAVPSKYIVVEKTMAGTPANRFRCIVQSRAMCTPCVECRCWVRVESGELTTVRPLCSGVQPAEVDADVTTDWFVGRRKAINRRTAIWMASLLTVAARVM